MTTLRPPDVPQRSCVHRAHGIERHDPYHWISDGDDPAVEAHLEAENAHAAASLAHLGELQQAVVRETLTRSVSRDTTAVVEDGPWVYYRRAEPGGAPRYCRRPRGGGPEQVLVDLDALAAAHAYLRICQIAPSPDHRFLAVVMDTQGTERCELAFLDLTSGAWLPHRIPDVSDSAWASDGRSILYCALDDVNRAHRIHCHAVGSSGPDPIVYEEEDPQCSVVCWLSESREWLVVGSVSNAETELSLVPAATPGAAPRLVRSRQPGLRYFPTPVGDTLWIHAADATGTRLMCTPIGALPTGAWREVIPRRPGVQLEGVHAFAEHLVITEREGGQVRLRVRALETGEEHVVALPEEVCKVALGDDGREFHARFTDNREFDTASLRITYTSLTTPQTVYRYDMIERELQLVYRVPVPGHDPSAYRTFRHHATAPDGTRVPITVVHRSDVAPGPDTPLVVFGYGAYGDTVDPEFRLPPWSYLARGGVFAIAHVRGGGYLGRAWYEAGRLEHKQNTFSDFIAAVRGLHDAGLGSPRCTALRGMSGGGLLIGAVLNQAPGLCTAALAEVPFVDVLTAMMDTSLPLTTLEWEEWGDPREPEAYRWIAAYSPYDNVIAQPYPDLLVTAGRADPWVPYWGPAKWAAKLRANATAGDVLLLTQTNAGHKGRSRREQQVEDRAWKIAWLLDRLGMASAEPLVASRTD